MRARALAAVLALSGLVACADDPSVEPPPDAGRACETEPDIETGTTSHAVEVNGQNRAFTLHVPPAYDPSRALPAMFTFHGLGGSGEGQALHTGLTELADDEGFLLIAPDGRGQPRGWDLTIPPEDPDSEPAFIEQLVDHVDGLVCVDPDRRYVTGYSNGSVVAFAVVCLTDIDIAGIGGMGALVSTDVCENDRQIPWIYIHATDDPVVPFAGGPSPIGDLGPVPDNLDTWAGRNGCEIQEAGTEGDGGIETWTWPGCDAEARALIADSGGHTWPHGSHGGPDLDAGAAMWEFFESLDGP